MRRNVPAEDELLVGWWDGGPRVQLPTWDLVTRSDEFKTAVTPLVETNGSTSIDSEFGSCWSTSRPSSRAPTAGPSWS